MTKIQLTTEERLALLDSVHYSIDAVHDLFLHRDRSSEERHRAARMAVAVAHAIDGIESGALDLAAPHMREWLTDERALTAEYAAEHAQWLRDLRERVPRALEHLSPSGELERMSPSDVRVRERELSREVDDALELVCTCDRLLAAASS